MRNTDQPVITDAFDAENLTRVEFRPDLERFGMESLDPDSLAFMMKRTWDTAACLADKGVSVTWNGKRVPFQSFEEYLRLHGDVRKAKPQNCGERGEDWKVFGRALTVQISCPNIFLALFHRLQQERV